MSDHAGLFWNRRSVRVVGFTTAGRKGSTTVRIELAVTSPWDLGDLMRDLAALRDAPVASGETARG